MGQERALGSEDFNSNGGRSRHNSPLLNLFEVFVQIAVIFSLLFLFVNNWYLRRDLAVMMAEMEIVKQELFIPMESGEDAESNSDGSARWRRSSGAVEPPAALNAIGVSNTSKEWSQEETQGPQSKPVHKKQKKIKIRGHSAERFFTETRSTTSTPIMVRQSRTKPTHASSSGKALFTGTRNYHERVAGMKDTVTKEEAIRRVLQRQESSMEALTAHLEDDVEVLSVEATPKPSSSSCHVLSAHFMSDTAAYSTSKHPHYQGNGRIKVSGVYKDWKPAHWTQKMGMTKFFHLHQGNVTVLKDGIYLVYAQIHYANVQEVNGYRVVRNSEAISQCSTTTAHPDRREVKSHTCSVSTTVLLRAQDRIHIADLHFDRYVILTPERSYFGLILLSPVHQDLTGR